MNFLTSFFHRSAKNPKRNALGQLLRRVREHIVAVGMSVLLLLLLGVLLFDGLVFYLNLVQHRQPAAANANERKINLSEKSIADVLISLDARQKKFDEILNAASGTKHATSSPLLPPETPRVRH